MGNEWRVAEARDNVLGNRRLFSCVGLALAPLMWAFREIAASPRCA